MLRDGGHITGVVADLGCGTGILAREIAAAGFTVVGIDLSPSMIAVAESHAPNAQFRVGSLHESDLPRCVAVCAVGEALSYLRPGESHIDLRPLFSRVSAALEPGGLFLFDVVETGKAEPMTYRASRSGPGWEVEAVVSEDASQAVIARTITTRRFEGVEVHCSTELHRIQVFSRTALEDLLAGCGFRVEMADRYPGVSLPPRRVGVVAEKLRT
jgi:predicted TPR repeat methyltransferase